MQVTVDVSAEITCSCVIAGASQEDPADWCIQHGEGSAGSWLA